MGHNKDILWKGLLEWIFDDLLRFLYPDADEVFDLKASPGFMDKEFAALSPEPVCKITVRAVDKLVKVKLRKKPSYALVHLEVQGQTKKSDRRLFGERMFGYFNLILAYHRRPLASIAIFTGSDGHLMPTGHSYSFMDTRLPYRYKTIDIRDYSDEELAASDNCFAWVLLVAKQALLSGKNREQKLLEKKWLIFQKLYENGLFEDCKLQAILAFMEQYLPFKDEEITRTFNDRVDSLTSKKNTMDIFEQIAEMKKEKVRQEAKEEFVRSLLNNSEFSDRKIALIVGVSRYSVTKIRKILRTKQRKKSHTTN